MSQRAPRSYYFPSTHWDEVREAIAAARAAAQLHGFVLVIRRSRKNLQGINPNEILTVDMECRQATTSHPDRVGAGLRQVSTMRCDCPYKVNIRSYLIQGVRWYQIAPQPHPYNVHNHDFEDVRGFAIARRLTEEQLAHVVTLLDVGTPPRQVIRSLQQSFPEAMAIKRDIYNASARLRRQELVGRTSIEALIDSLVSGNKSDPNYWDHRLQVDELNQVSHLFIACKRDVVKNRRFSKVIHMDSTYKTNRKRLPLLNICGFTSINTTFEIGLCWKINELERSYIWSLSAYKEIKDAAGVPDPEVIVVDRCLALINAIQVVFSRTYIIICRWHVFKNIATNCKRGLTKIEWTFFEVFISLLFYSNTSEVFEQRWKEMGDNRITKETWTAMKKSKFSEDFIQTTTENFNSGRNRQFINLLPDSKHEKIFSYMKGWLEFKENIVSCFQDRVRHFSKFFFTMATTT
jgi:hypothetical protein